MNASIASNASCLSSLGTDEARMDGNEASEDVREAVQGAELFLLVEDVELLRPDPAEIPQGAHPVLGFVFVGDVEGG